MLSLWTHVPETDNVVKLELALEGDSGKDGENGQIVTGASYNSHRKHIKREVLWVRSIGGNSAYHDLQSGKAERTQFAIQLRIHGANEFLQGAELVLHSALVSQKVDFLSNASKRVSVAR